MTISPTNESERKNQEIERYKQFVNWIFWAAFIFGTIQLFAYKIFDIPLIGLTGLVVLGYGICLLVAKALLRQSRIYAAVMTSSIGLLVATLLLTLSLPIAIPAISILPLIAIAHSLPYLPKRETLLIIFASWLIAVVVISFNALFPSSIIGLPSWFSTSFRVSSFGAALGILLLLLWQFTSRLTDMLEKTRNFNVILETQATQLKIANEELKQFASIVSHDLRAPLLNIRGFSKELRIALEEVESKFGHGQIELSADQFRALTDALEKDIPEALEFIDSSVVRMDGFLNALLKLSRLGKRELHFETINMQGLVNETLKTLGHKIETNQIQVIVKPLPQIRADRISIEQIFGNILTNAVNYLDTSRPGKVMISAESTGHEIIFRVEDNGRGIAESDYPKVFAPLRRAGRQDIPGEGMGLAYVQTLVRLHKGEIWFESQPDVGTIFFFSISRSLNGGTHVE